MSLHRSRQDFSADVPRLSASRTKVTDRECASKRNYGEKEAMFETCLSLIGWGPESADDFPRYPAMACDDAHGMRSLAHRILRSCPWKRPGGNQMLVPGSCVG